MTDILDRRDFLFGSAAAATTVVTGAPSALSAERPASLVDAAAPLGIDIGTAYNGVPDRDLIRIIRENCSLITPENALKPRAVAPEKGVYDFAMARAIHDFSRLNNKKFHGHTLFWHGSPLDWARSTDFDEVKRTYRAFVGRVISAFPAAVSWDVLNEVFEEDTRLRNDILINRFGIDFLEFLLKETKSASPFAKTVINDYNLDCAAKWCGRKRRNALSVVEELKKRGAPVDAVGIQGHLSSKYRPSPARTLAFIRELDALNVDTYISELDVNDVDFADRIETRDRQVAETYDDFLTAVLKARSVKRIVFWGISDAHNWIVRGEAGDSRPAGTARPALFDGNNRPKPAFYAVLKALREAAGDRAILSVAEAQRILAQQGFDPGPPDGLWGKRTLKALNALRRSRGLGPTSSFDTGSQQLLKALGR